MSTQRLLPVVSAWLPLRTHSLLTFTLVLHHRHSVVFLKLTVSSSLETGLQFPQRLTQAPQIRPLVDTVHFKGFYLLTNKRETERHLYLDLSIYRDAKQTDRQTHNSQ